MNIDEPKKEINRAHDGIRDECRVRRMARNIFSSTGVFEKVSVVVNIGHGAYRTVANLPKRQRMHNVSRILGIPPQSTREVVINDCHGGFSISGEAIRWLLDNGWKDSVDNEDQLTPCFMKLFSPRDHPLLVRCVKELGKRANGDYAKLKIVEIPFHVEWMIEESEGDEWISEKHRTWSR